MSSADISPHYKSVHEIIAEKKQQVAELQELYQEQKNKANSNKEKLNLEYLALKAEEEILKAGNQKEIPKCKSLLFAWTYQKLQNNVKELEELLSFQKDMENISVEKEIELSKLCQTESSPLNSHPLSDFEELKNIENLRSEILFCLHQKLIRRLRRICREYFPVLPGNEKADKKIEKAEKKRKDLFFLLQKLFPDLKDDSVKPEEWGKKRAIKIEESYPQSYVELLLSSKMVDYYKDQRNCLTVNAR